MSHLRIQNFEVHELVDGWVGQAPGLVEALELKKEILRDVPGAEVKIMAEVVEVTQ